MNWLYACPPGGQVARFGIEQRSLVGRASASTEPGTLGVRGDPSLSRRHFWVEPVGELLRVTRCSEATNSVVWEGVARDRFEVPSGARFTAGRTEFQYVRQQPAASSDPDRAQEVTLTPRRRDRAREIQAGVCLEALTDLLPRLREAGDPRQLWQAAVSTLRRLLARAGTVSAVDGKGAVLAGDRRLPSRRLLDAALQRSQAVLFVDQEFTRAAGTGWAVAAPVLGAEGAVFLYAEGQDPGDQPGQSELVLLELVGEALSHHLAARRAERIQAQVGQFFSPSLRQLVVGRGLEELMRPALHEVTVMFFDLRGFSRAAEMADLARHHAQLVEVMTLVTEHVFSQDGTVVDYAGDSVLAVWGAPIDQEDHARRAAAAATAVLEDVQALGLGAGIGMASGPVVAGQVGARGHAKFGLLGMVVNQASRLEGLTKRLGAPLLMTGSTAPSAGIPVRKVGTVVPAGMEEPLELWEGFLPGSGLEPADLKTYEEAQALLGLGQPQRARPLLERLSGRDPVSRFVLGTLENGVEPFRFTHK